MKVPFPANSAKPLNFTIGTAPPYEPNSVLDLRRSPSPQKVTQSDHLLLDHHTFDDWDSLMKELGLHDDPADTKPSPIIHDVPPPVYSTFPHPANQLDSIQFLPADFGLVSDAAAYSPVPLTHGYDSISAGGGFNAGFEFIDDLIQLAECLETNSLQLGHAVLARLNQRLGSPVGGPLQRGAFYFKEALQSLLAGPVRPAHRPASSSEIIQKIKAEKIFSTVSPIPLFSSFTANQAVLEALDGSTSAHIIDFDIGFGGQWASFMKELAERSYSCKTAPAPALRVSAVVPDEYAAESALIRENLAQFARELSVRFEIDFISMDTFEYLNFQAIRFMDGEKLAVVLSPAVFRRSGVGFLNGLRQLSPRVVVHVDADVQISSVTPSYRQAVIEGLEFYSTILESLEAANSNGGDWMRRIETSVVSPKIAEALEAEGRRGMTCKEALLAAGLRQVGASQFAEFQAECLLRRVQVRGFHVVKRQAEMLLCWHDRPIVATSAWKY